MMNFRKVSVSILPMLFLCVCMAMYAAEPSPFQKYMRFQSTVRTFTASFEQRKNIEILDEPVISKGTIVVSKPGKLWWNFDAPEKRLVVSDGKKIWDYDPELETVEIYDVSSNPDILRAVNTFKHLLGIGGEKIVKDYNVTTRTIDKKVSFTLVPQIKELKEHIVEIVIITDDQYHLLETSFTASDKSKTVLRFSKMKENVRVDKTLFLFTPPDGVSVEYPLKKKRDMKK